jgi:hypothetical protein
MSPFARSGWFCLACALAAFFPLGCTPNLEKNEHFAQEKARLDRVDEDLKNARIEVTKLSNEVGRLSSEMAALKKGVPAGGVPSDVLDGLTQRLTTLEGQVRSLANAPKVSAAAPKSAAAGSEAEETESPAPTSRTRLTPSAAKSSAAKSATAKSVSAKSAPSPKGQVALTVNGSRNRAALASRAGAAATPKKTASTARRTESAGDSAPRITSPRRAGIELGSRLRTF